MTLGLATMAFLAVDAQVQIISKSPSTVIDDNSGDWGFSNANAVKAHDNNMASATATLTLLSGHTDYLKTSGYNINVPAGMVIKGIQVDIEKSAYGVTILAWINDYRVRLMKNGVFVGSNYAKGGSWPTNDQYYTYGGASDLWGTTWTAAEVNNANFGVAFSAEISGLLGVLPTANLDHMRITVTYQNLTLPIRLENFKGLLGSNGDVKLNWSAAGENANSSFMVQRSFDGDKWTDLRSIAFDATGVQRGYTYTDQQPRGTELYYRIATRNDGLETTFSNIITIKKNDNTQVSLYPNPASDVVTVESKEKISSLQCYNSMGIAQQVQMQRVSDNVEKITVTRLQPGIYYLSVNGEMKKLIKK